MFELYKRYELTAAKGTISDTGIALIMSLIYRQNLQSEDWKALNPNYAFRYLPALPDDWQWVWSVAGKGEYVGKFTRRLEKFYFKQGVKCLPAFLTEVGNIARAHSADEVTYRFEIVDEFDWQDGDFGDAGSCYWNDRTGARQMLKDNGAMAILFYNDDDTGLGRAWLVGWRNDTYIIFNGYGVAGDSTLKIASIFGTFLNAAYRKISLTNDGSSGGVLWINSGTGYIVGASDDICHISSVDFGWTEINSHFCESCGCGMDEDDVYYGADGYDYCERCFDRNFSYCDQCGDTEFNDELTRTSDDRYLCDQCIERHYTCCDDCGEYVPDGEITRTDDGEYCENCYTPPDDEESEG